MHFDFSDEQKALRDSLRRNLEKNCPLSSVRAIIDSAAGHDAALWRNLSQGGFLAAAIPEAFGGVGAGYLELCVVAEECGRALAPLPTVSSVYQATEFLLAAGSATQKAAWLPKLASGELIGNALAPGLFRTKMSDSALDFEDATVLAKVASPLGQRVGTPEDIVGGVIYLSSRAGAWLSGVTIPISGGRGTIE